MISERNRSDGVGGRSIVSSNRSFVTSFYGFEQAVDASFQHVALNVPRSTRQSTSNPIVYFQAASTVRTDWTDIDTGDNPLK
jgi:hypothetical protein